MLHLLSPALSAAGTVCVGRVVQENGSKHPRAPILHPQSRTPPAFRTFRRAAFGAVHPVPPGVLQPLAGALQGLRAAGVEVEGGGGWRQQAGGVCGRHAGLGGRTPAQLQLLELLLELGLAGGVLAGAAVGGQAEQGVPLCFQLGTAPQGAVVLLGDDAPQGNGRALAHFQDFWRRACLLLKKEKNALWDPLHRCSSHPTCSPPPHLLRRQDSCHLQLKPWQFGHPQGLSCLPSTAPTPQFCSRGCAGDTHGQPGGGCCSCPCWGMSLEGDTGRT